MSTEAVAISTPSRGADIIIPLGIIGIVLMMVLPIPAMLLDILLSFSQALAIGVFLTALFIEEALEFSAFPAFVLIATLLRLSLNVATTRLILLHGGEGAGAAGSVVEAFGRFVVEGNVLVGLVVFLILAVINFVVVTKGAGRVAEVSARFTLDAMPGKQMAIDADLSSGSINNDQARGRRKKLEREADFYGAMDGASKFVHGDAVAGLLITAINLIGGLILGVSRGMDLSKAAETFSVLSVGDALASQIPALLISAASGIVVTRSATGDQLGRAFGTQLFGRRKPVAMTAGILTVLALMPGMPTVSCLMLAGGFLMLSRKIGAPSAVVAKVAPPPAANDPKRAASEVDASLALDLLSLEVGYELVGLVDATRGGTLLDRVAMLRQQLAKDLGMIMPPVHVCDNLQLPPGAYRVLISGNAVGAGSCKAGRLLAVDPIGQAPPIQGEKTMDPTFGMPARWIAVRDKEMAEALGYTVVDHATVIATHLGELLRVNAHKLLGRQEVQHLLDVLAKTAPKIVDDVVPNLLSLGDVVRILRNLVREGISIRDLADDPRLARRTLRANEGHRTTHGAGARAAGLAHHLTRQGSRRQRRRLDARSAARRGAPQVAARDRHRHRRRPRSGAPADTRRQRRAVRQKVHGHLGHTAGRHVSRLAALRPRRLRTQDPPARGRLVPRNRPDGADPGPRPARAQCSRSVRSP